MFWGCVSAHCKLPLIEIRGNLNSHRYVNEILEASAIPHLDNHPLADRPIFQQDGATSHTAGISMDCLRQNAVDVLEWPAKSPDQSPIENIWDWIKRELNQPNNVIADMADLRVQINTAWNNIQQHRISALISSCKRRAQALVTSRGDFTKY